MRLRTVGVAAVILSAACSSAPAVGPDPTGATPPYTGYLEDHDPQAPTWVGPATSAPGTSTSATPVAAGDPVDLGISTQDPAVTVVHFVVDAVEVGTCDTTEPGSDCHTGSLWQWTVAIATPGHHTLEVWYTDGAGHRVSVTREIDIAPAAPSQSPIGASTSEPDSVPVDQLVLDGHSSVQSSPDPRPTPSELGLTSASTPPAPTARSIPQTPRGYLDPSHGSRSAFGGIAWSVSGQRVLLDHGSLDADTIVLANCIRQYDDSARRYGTLNYVSRASLIATAVAATGCSATASPNGILGIRGSTCAVIAATDGTNLSPAACAQRMHDSPDFAFSIGARWLNTGSMRAVHHSDPPLIAAAVSTGVLGASRGNPWHLLTHSDASGQRDFVTSFVAAYNAFRSVEAVTAQLDQTLPGAYQTLRQGDAPPLVGGSTPASIQARFATPSALPPGPPSNTSMIQNHGGPVVSGGPLNVGIVWWGGWDGLDARKQLIRDFINGLNDSPWWDMETTYTDGAGNPVTRNVHIVAEHTTPVPLEDDDRYWIHGHDRITPSADAPQMLAQELVTYGVTPNDANTITLVLSDDVMVPVGMCDTACGWHQSTTRTDTGERVLYAYAGSSALCPDSCAAQHQSPNGDAVADGMISVIAHELAEAASDPEVTTWFDTEGEENADKCAWTWGDNQAQVGGGFANLYQGGHFYLVQQNWVNVDTGYCSMRINTP